MSMILKLTLVTALYVPSIYCDNCYWSVYTRCGVETQCLGNDPLIRYRLSPQCVLSPEKYCCPSGPGAEIGFCEDINFQGDCFSHSIQKDECVNLDKNDVASSVNTFGGCFRLYEHKGCQGKSTVVRPGSNAHNNLEALGMNDMVSSASLCFSTDKSDGDNRYKRSSGNNNFQLAGETLTLGFLPWLTRDTSNLGNDNPVVFYQIGPKNRTEVMEAVIYPRHLGTGTPTNRAARNFARSMGNPNDDAGHILAQRLGGSGTDLRNIFPQSRNINRGVWAQVESTVDDFVRTYGSVRFTVNLEYVNRNVTRPYQIVYRIRAGGNNIFINDMVNPE